MERSDQNLQDQHLCGGYQEEPPRIFISRAEQQSVLALVLVLSMIGATIGIKYLFSLSSIELNRIHDIAETVAGFSAFLFTLLGYISAAWWWWHRDPRRPRVNVAKQVSVFPLNGGEHILEVILSVHNVGEVPLVVSEWEIYAFRVWPPQDGKIEALRGADGFTLRREDFLEEEAEAGKPFKKIAHLAERVRPGETQEFAASMLIPKGVDAVRLEAQIPHDLLSHTVSEDRAWMKFTIVDLRSGTRSDRSWPHNPAAPADQKAPLSGR